MTLKRLTPVCACLIFILAPAFASRQLPDYPAKAASDYSIKAAEAGAIVGIEPFDESGLQKTYFNASLTEKGILPVFVVLQNTSATDSIIFDKSAIGLAAPPTSQARKTAPSPPSSAPEGYLTWDKCATLRTNAKT